MPAIERDGITIYIVDTSVAASDLTSSDKYNGSITNYSQSGGEQEFEVTNAFGGDIQRTMPRGEFELSMEVTPSYDNEVSDFASLFMGEDSTNTGAYTSAQQADLKKVFVEAYDGDSNYVTHAFNNARVISFEPEHSADDTKTLSITFNTPALTESGKPNYVTEAVEATSFAGFGNFDAA